MTTRTEEWREVADDVSGLAMKLKLHFEQAASETAGEARGAVEAVGDGVEAAFDGLRDAIKDPAVKQDVKEVAVALRDALTHAFDELTAQLRQSCEHHDT